MNDKFINTKNLIWTVSVIVCLLAVFVGFIYAAVNRYYYDHEIPVVNLGAAEKTSGDSREEDSSDEPQAGVLNGLRKNKHGADDYIQKLTFLCDSVYSSLPECGVDASMVWLGSEGTFSVSGLSSNMISNPNDGSLISAADAVMVYKPDILVILVGTDGLYNTDEDTFKAQYSQLIRSVLSFSGDTRIICCSIASVTPGCIPTDGLTIEMVDNANVWLKDVCTEYAVWYADTASEICQDRFLKSEYASSDGRTLNINGISKVFDFLNEHALETD